MGGERSPSFLSALTESEDFLVLRENRKYNHLLGNCFFKKINLKHNLYLLFLQHLSIQISCKWTICGMTDKQAFFSNLKNLLEKPISFSK